MLHYRSLAYTCLFLFGILVSWAPITSASDWIYTVRPGDNLWTISVKHLKNLARVGELQKHNKIQDPHRIPPGFRIKIPVSWMRTSSSEARVQVIVGSPTRSTTANSDSTKLLPDQAVNLGDTIETDAISTVTLLMADGSRLIMLPNSKLTMEQLKQYQHTEMVDSRLFLDQGRIEILAKPAAGPGSRFQIKTPSAITAVRGTFFRVGAFNGISLNETLEGKVAVAAEGSSTAVNAGFGVTIKSGEKPSRPITLLPGPQLHFPKALNRLIMELAWPPVAGAVGYRVQVYARNNIKELLQDKITETNKVILPAPDDGEYRLIVRAIDENQLEGINSEGLFTVDARPVPPPVSGPYADSRIIQDEPIEFSWNVPKNSKEFHLQIFDTDSPSNPITDEQGLSSPQHNLPNGLSPGEYSWRTATTNNLDDKGPFGDRQNFKVLNTPETPSVGEPELGDEQIRISWSDSPGTKAYEFQLSKKDDFSTVLLALSTQESFIFLNTLEPGSYYFRIRGVTQDDVNGNYSDVSQLKIPSPPTWPLKLFGSALLLFI